MKGRQALSGRRHLPSGPFLPAITGIALLAGCTGSTSTPDVTSATPAGGATVATPIEGPGVNPSTEPLLDDQEVDQAADLVADQAAEAEYPSDDGMDDPAGMIVTGTDENGGSMAVSPWLASIRLFRRESEPSGRGTVTVELARYAENFPVAAHIGFYAEALDECTIRNRESQSGVNPDNPPPPGLDGGDTVVLNMPSGPFLSLGRRLTSDQQLSYQAQTAQSGPLPEEATLSIPGAAFPTVAAYPLYEPEPVVRLHPDDSLAVTAESQFSWIPSHPSTHVKIDFMAFDELGDFLWYPVSCWVKDDGTFELPTAVNEALEPFESLVEPAHRLRVRYSRVYSRVDLLGGIVFHQRLEIAE